MRRVGNRIRCRPPTTSNCHARSCWRTSIAPPEILRARAQYDAARVAFEAMMRRKPNDPMLHSKLGMALAGLGRTNEAIRAGKRAMESVPESVDGLDGPMYSVDLLYIYASLQRTDDTLPLLARLLETPGGIIAESLRHDPSWDFLRGDARFQALLTQHGVAS